MEVPVARRHHGLSIPTHVKAMSRLQMPAIYRAFAILLRPCTRAAVIAAALALAACASAPLEELAQARVTVALAARVGSASAEIARASNKLALAQRWVDANDHGPARWLVEQAQLDAELALAKAATEDARRAAALSPSSPAAGPTASREL